MWQSVSTVILAGVGAFIATFAAKLIESFVRKSQSIEGQRDADLAEILQMSSIICDRAEKFWSKSAAELGPENAVLRAHILASQHNLAEVVNRLFTSPGKWECDVKLHKLMIAATGGDFGEPDRDAEPQRLTEIFILSRALDHSAKAARRNLPRKFMS